MFGVVFLPCQAGSTTAERTEGHLFVKNAFFALLFVAGIVLAMSKAAVLGADTWAVLVAGSSGWTNYRHQADICHAYQSLLARGVHKEKIITMMYDDIAFNRNNPHEGVIINRPDGPNVYDGVHIDYKTKDVTVRNFFNVLLGNKSEMKKIGTGRVIKSGPDDTVFINFADHGARGILGFPNEYLYSDDLISTIHKMAVENRFGKLILIIEACESGSMFDNLIKHFNNVFAITAAATDESSWAWYCTDRKYHTCLGDLFSISWMERLDKLNKSETLFDNYDAVRTRVRSSHVNVYGDYKVGFQEEFLPAQQKPSGNIVTHKEVNSGVDNREVSLHIAKMEALYTNSSEKHEDLVKIIQARTFADKLITRILHVYTDGDHELKKYLESLRFPVNLNMFDCYKRIVRSFDNHCFQIYKNTYFLRHLYKFANICTKEMGTDKAVSSIVSVCQDQIEKIRNMDVDIE